MYRFSSMVAAMKRRIREPIVEATGRPANAGTMDAMRSMGEPRRRPSLRSLFAAVAVAAVPFIR
ncbi:hypothetical protein [Burkholderia oklahomensis]|uniref:hypothetical protein n=1 Tax=Burkholderia oklahomensis TaxID=342113 RepID=UPI00016A85A1|nr:hypothetical protein [Burkholderia oklahomensis]AOI38434.1 hypothetical protein WG70_01535 [Burkholderia oklahomensis EO147]MBI0363716.1 hypothetical protein [Burkholderia oklahomensis]MDN7674585.1 hypothetical protein [Burkholderia oklahomensis]QPS41223.1 hypothetical protein I6G57_23650 [Burkholderia oklahomensis]